MKFIVNIEDLANFFENYFAGSVAMAQLDWVFLVRGTEEDQVVR